MTRVLLIDDCEEFCDATADLLADAGYDVSIALDAAAALELCQDEQFEVILCDLVMPLPASLEADSECDSAMVGLSLLRSVKQRFPHVPIVIISGQLVGEGLEAMRRFGADATLCKPFAQQDLVNCIEKVVAKQSGQ
jgi:CheY-like chemotaxis protein